MHPIRPIKRRRKVGDINWPTYQGTATLVGKSPSGRVTVYYDTTLGTQGLTNAQALVSLADGACQKNDTIFGTTGGPVNVIIFALGGATDGTGGADHASCDYQTGGNIEVDASFGASQRVLALFEAELSECSMGGNLCGVSTGEALSRWCANIIAPGALSDFASAPTWYQDGMPNWVDRTNPTDQDYDSIGCGMAFLSWLQLLGYPLTSIAPVMVSLQDTGTFAQVYAKLTSNAPSSAWPKFSSAVQALGSITNDDPFSGVAPPKPPAPVPTPAPTTFVWPTTLVAMDATGKAIATYTLTL